MSFYIFRQKTLVKGGAATLDGVPDNMDPLTWVQGKIMTAPAKDLILDLSLESGSFRGAIIDGFLTLYHQKLCKALTDFGIDNIQFFPVTLRNQATKKNEPNYSLVNIIGLLDCIDMDKSNVNWWPSGMGFDFVSIEIDANKTQGLSIFRLKDDPSKVIINERLKEHLEKNKVLVGVQLIASQDYSDW